MNLVAELDAFVANVHARTSDQLAHLLLRLAAEAALELTLLVPETKHASTYRFVLVLGETDRFSLLKT